MKKDRITIFKFTESLRKYNRSFEKYIYTLFNDLAYHKRPRVLKKTTLKEFYH